MGNLKSRFDFLLLSQPWRKLILSRVSPFSLKYSDTTALLKEDLFYLTFVAVKTTIDYTEGLYFITFSSQGLAFII